MPKGDALIIMLEKFFCSLRKSDVGAPAQLECFWVMHRRSQEKSASPALVERLYECFQGITWYLQLSMNEAFTMAERGGCVDEEAYDQILNHLVDSKRFTFEDRYASLTEKQKTVLLAIASEFPNQVTLTSEDFITRYNLKTSSSVQTAVKGLVEKGILSDKHGARRPTDLLFMLWLKDF